VDGISYQGAVTRICVATEGVSLVATVPAGTSCRKGDRVSLVWAQSAMMAKRKNKKLEKIIELNKLKM